MKTIIVGSKGQIGSALMEVLDPYRPKGVDLAGGAERTDEMVLKGETCDVLHIAMGYGPAFVKSVKEYQRLFKPSVATIIHSTVEEGTSRKLGCVFSPVTGRHPALAESIRRSVRFLAGKDASKVADYWRRVGLEVVIMDNSDALEYAKLRQTKFYNLQVAFVKDTKLDCLKKGYSFAEAYTLPSQDYNRLYASFNSPYHLPLLTPILTPTGGHCLGPNLDLQPDDWSDFLREKNG